MGEVSASDHASVRLRVRIDCASGCFDTPRRRSQVVRQETANLSFVGSIPTGASDIR